MTDAKGSKILPSSWDLRMTASVVESEARIRWSAPLRSGGEHANDAARCSRWAYDLLVHLFDLGMYAAEHVVSWTVRTPAGQPAEAVTLHRITDDRRHTGELRFPSRWRDDEGLLLQAEEEQRRAAPQLGRLATRGFVRRS